MPSQARFDQALYRPSRQSGLTFAFVQSAPRSDRPSRCKPV